MQSDHLNDEPELRSSARRESQDDGKNESKGFFMTSDMSWPILALVTAVVFGVAAVLAQPRKAWDPRGKVPRTTAIMKD
jgi:hypothetical protein